LQNYLSATNNESENVRSLQAVDDDVLIKNDNEVDIGDQTCYVYNPYNNLRGKGNNDGDVSGGDESVTHKLNTQDVKKEGTIFIYSQPMKEIDRQSLLGYMGHTHESIHHRKPST